MSRNDPSSFSAGEMIAESGIYRVQHAPHRRSHEVTLLQGELFPRCAVCKEQVRFELLQTAPRVNNAEFHVHLYEVPHPSDLGEESEEDKASA
jgi:hypothetical protein